MPARDRWPGRVLHRIAQVQTLLGLPRFVVSLVTGLMGAAATVAALWKLVWRLDPVMAVIVGVLVFGVISGSLIGSLVWWELRTLRRIREAATFRPTPMAVDGGCLAIVRVENVGGADLRVVARMLAVRIPGVQAPFPVPQTMAWDRDRNLIHPGEEPAVLLVMGLSEHGSTLTFPHAGGIHIDVPRAGASLVDCDIEIECNRDGEPTVLGIVMPIAEGRILDCILGSVGDRSPHDVARR